jgi:hypothetical protein
VNDLSLLRNVARDVGVAHRRWTREVEKGGNETALTTRLESQLINAVLRFNTVLGDTSLLKSEQTRAIAQGFGNNRAAADWLLEFYKGLEEARDAG